MRLTVTLAALALAAHTAHAEPDRVDPTTATFLSLGATGAGLALVGVGAATGHGDVENVGAGVALLGPSVGHWYAHDTFTVGLGVRAVGAGVVIAGLLDRGPLCGAGCAERPGATLLIVAGSALILGGALHDLGTAGDAADAWNREHGHDLSIAPTAVRTPRGDTVPGLALSGTF